MLYSPQTFIYHAIISNGQNRIQNLLDADETYKEYYERILLDVIRLLEKCFVAVTNFHSSGKTECNTKVDLTCLNHRPIIESRMQKKKT